MANVVKLQKKGVDPFEDTGEIANALEHLSEKYAMTPGDAYWIHEAIVSLLAMQVSIELFKKTQAEQ